jgi:hypothetical protein
MLPVPTAIVIPVEISEAAFLATTSIVSSKLVEEEDDEEVASPSPLLLFDDDDDDAEKTNPLPLLFCLFFVFAFLLAKKRLLCFKLHDDDDDEEEEEEEEEEKEVLVLFPRERKGARVVGDAKQTLPDMSRISMYYYCGESLFRILSAEEKRRKKTNERQHTNERTRERVPPTCPLPLPRRRRLFLLYRSGFARTTSWRSVT